MHQRQTKDKDRVGGDVHCIAHLFLQHTGWSQNPEHRLHAFTGFLCLWWMLPIFLSLSPEKHSIETLGHPDRGVIIVDSSSYFEIPSSQNAVWLIPLTQHLLTVLIISWLQDNTIEIPKGVLRCSKFSETSDAWCPDHSNIKSNNWGTNIGNFLLAPSGAHSHNNYHEVTRNSLLNLLIETRYRCFCSVTSVQLNA